MIVISVVQASSRTLMYFTVLIFIIDTFTMHRTRNLFSNWKSYLAIIAGNVNNNMSIQLKLSAFYQ